MTDEEIKISIAIGKFCGWKWINALYYPWINPYNKKSFEYPSNYANDLNAMHEAEMILRGTDKEYFNDIFINRRWKEYQYRLIHKYGASATARERALIFIEIITQLPTPPKAQ
jgi:hypothetical protein